MYFISYTLNKCFKISCSFENDLHKKHWLEYFYSLTEEETVRVTEGEGGERKARETKTNIIEEEFEISFAHNNGMIFTDESPPYPDFGTHNKYGNYFDYYSKDVESKIEQIIHTPFIALGGRGLPVRETTFDQIKNNVFGIEDTKWSSNYDKSVRPIQETKEKKSQKSELVPEKTGYHVQTQPVRQSTVRRQPSFRRQPVRQSTVQRQNVNLHRNAKPYSHDVLSSLYENYDLYDNDDLYDRDYPSSRRVPKTGKRPGKGPGKRQGKGPGKRQGKGPGKGQKRRRNKWGGGGNQNKNARNKNAKIKKLREAAIVNKTESHSKLEIYQTQYEDFKKFLNNKANWEYIISDGTFRDGQIYGSDYNSLKNKLDENEAHINNIKRMYGNTLVDWNGLKAKIGHDDLKIYNTNGITSDLTSSTKSWLKILKRNAIKFKEQWIQSPKEEFMNKVKQEINDTIEEQINNLSYHFTFRIKLKLNIGGSDQVMTTDALRIKNHETSANERNHIINCITYADPKFKNKINKALKLVKRDC